MDRGAAQKSDRLERGLNVDQLEQRLQFSPICVKSEAKKQRIDICSHRFNIFLFFF